MPRFKTEYFKSEKINPLIYDLTKQAKELYIIHQFIQQILKEYFTIIIWLPAIQ